MNFLDKKVSVYSLVFFRIMFGILAFAEATALLSYYHLYNGAYDPNNFQFKYFGFEWVQPLPFIPQTIFFGILIFAATLIALGKWYRFATIFYAFGITYTFLLEKSYYLNHGYFLCLLSFLIIFMPLDRYFSLRTWKHPEQRITKVPYWNLFILKFMMGVVYFYGGLAKINWDWLNAKPLDRWLANKSDMFLLGPLWSHEWTAWFMSYGGLLLDLFVVPMLIISKPTRWLALLGVVFFHVVNAILFKIGIFPWLSITMTLLFFAPDFPLQVIDWVKEKIPLIGRLQLAWNQRMETSPNSYNNLQPTNKLFLSGLIFFMILQLVIPFRHHLIPGDVAWTEEGHRFSWRMMLRSKRGKGYFKVKNLDTNKVDRINLKDHLSRRQQTKMMGQPDMVYQFAQKLKVHYHEKGMDNIVINAKVETKLNGRDYELLIDPKVDLAQVEWTVFGHNLFVTERRKSGF